jgi:hypothetical protein
MTEVPPEERLYAVMTDSPRDRSVILARVAPPASKEDGFWTARDPERLWLMSRDDAISVRDRLGHNNPRIVRAEKALEIIRRQAGEPEAAPAEPEALADTAENPSP